MVVIILLRQQVVSHPFEFRVSTNSMFHAITYMHALVLILWFLSLILFYLLISRKFTTALH